LVFILGIFISWSDVNARLGNATWPAPQGIREAPYSPAGGTWQGVTAVSLGIAAFLPRGSAPVRRRNGGLSRGQVPPAMIRLRHGCRFQTSRTPAHGLKDSPSRGDGVATGPEGPSLAEISAEVLYAGTFRGLAPRARPHEVRSDNDGTSTAVPFPPGAPRPPVLQVGIRTAP